MTITNKIYKLFAIAVLTIVFNGIAEAQNSTSSPYSAFGIGQLTPQEDAVAMGMGHTGIALAPSDWINITNPAGIANLDSLTFHFNAQLHWFHGKEYTEQRYTQSVYRTNFDGISFGWRGKPWWAACIGYSPYSTVGYNIYDPYQYIWGSEERYAINFTGTGGVTRAFFNNAFTLFKHLTLGFSAGAIWGSISKKETAMFSNGETVYNLKKYTMNNFFFEYGLQFDFNVGKFNNFRFGAIYSNKTAMRSSFDHIVSNDISSNLYFDDVTPLDGEFTVPTTYGFGMTYNRRKFTASIDYRENLWGEVKNVKLRETARFLNNHSLGGGVEWACGSDKDPFYKRLRWRLGCYYETSYLGLNTKEIERVETVPQEVVKYDDETNSYTWVTVDMPRPILKKSGAELDALTFTAGLTIPMGRFRNAINIGYEYRKHGTKNNGMILEKFHNVKVALNIREMWFVKSKFD